MNDKLKKEIIYKLSIVSWMVSHFVLVIGGMIAFGMMSNWFIGSLIMIICWIIAATSVWAMIDYFD